MTAAAFDALGDPTRRRIVEVLSWGEQPAGAVVDAVQSEMSISQPAVSQHLKVLREAGLVTVRAEGTRRLYALDQEAIAAAGAWLAHLAEATGRLDQAFDALATEVERCKRARYTARSSTSRRRPA